MAGEIGELISNIITLPARQRAYQEQLATGRARRQLMQTEEQERQVDIKGKEQTLKERQFKYDEFLKLNVEDEHKLNLLSAYRKFDNKIDLDPEEETSTLYLLNHHNPIFQGKSVKQMQSTTEDLRTISGWMKQNESTLSSSLQKGEGVRIDRTQAPQVFDAFNRVYGPLIKQGTDKYGQPAQEKSVESFYVDPKDGTLVIGLRVKNSKGEVDSSAVSWGRTGDPSSQVLKIPIGLFSANLGGLTKFGEMMNGMAMRYGTDALQKKLDDTKTLKGKSEADQAGRKAVAEFLKTKPKASVNELRNAYAEAAGKLGVFSQKEIDEAVKTIVPEKPEMTEYQKRTLDIKEEGVGLKKKELGLKEKELGEKHTERKEREAQKPLSVTEQKEFNNEMFSRYSGLLHKEEDNRDEILRSKSFDRLMNSFPAQHQELLRDIRDRATELKQENRKLTWNQAISKAEQEMGKPEKILKPIPDTEIKDIIKKFKDMPKGPGKIKKMEEEARKRGWDPNEKEK
jgi:hypothetical protein